LADVQQVCVTQLGTERFQETGKYAAYLQTTEGRLRLDLSWTNLLAFLPIRATGGHALDIGGGNGCVAVRLATLGFDVELLDGSEAMLALAKRETEAKELSGRISFHHGDANFLCDLFEPASFDVVVCHNLLEYVEDPSAVLRGLAPLLKHDGESVVSAQR
jgi:S-adenosylmethionine-dependent methyltransferase